MKKVLTLVLAAALALSMSAVGFAASTTPIKDDYPSEIGYSNSSEGVANGNSLDLGERDNLVGEEFLFELIPSQWAGQNELTTAILSRNKITLKKKTSKGSELIKDVTLKNITKGSGANAYKTVAVKVEFVDPFVSTSTKEFDMTFYFAFDGKSEKGTEFNLVGEMKNREVEVDEDDEVNLSDGSYAKALSYTNNITVDTGNGLFIKTKMFEDKKYYAKSVQEITAADDEIIAKYPEIDTIYTLHTVNMNSAGNEVTFDIDDTFYVYNVDGKYIGTTKDKLPMSKKYYLATKKIDMGGEEAVEGEGEGEGDAPVDIDSPGTGGDDVPVNVNDNPGTGANGFVNVAVVAGLVALAAAGVSLKK